MSGRSLSHVKKHRVFSGAYGCPRCGGDTYVSTVTAHPLWGHRLRCMDCGSVTGVVHTPKTCDGDQFAIADYARSLWILPQSYYFETPLRNTWEDICDYARDNEMPMRCGVIQAHGPTVIPAGNSRRIGRLSVTLSSLPGRRGDGILYWVLIYNEKKEGEE